MTQVSVSEKSPTQRQRLVDAMEERRVSARHLAKRLAERTGGTHEAMRRNVTRWRRGEGISDELAWALADELGYPLGHFVRARNEKLTVADEIAALRRDVTAQLQHEREARQRELRDLRSELLAVKDAVRGEPAHGLEDAHADEARK